MGVSQIPPRLYKHTECLPESSSGRQKRERLPTGSCPPSHNVVPRTFTPRHLWAVLVALGLGKAPRQRSTCSRWCACQCELRLATSLQLKSEEAKVM